MARLEPDGGAFQKAQEIELSTEEGAYIFYTLDGSTPTSKSSIYISPIKISSSTMLKYRTWKKGKVWGDTNIAYFTIDNKLPTTLAISSGMDPQNMLTVKLKRNEMSNTYYSIDGSDPTIASLKYEHPFPIPHGTTIKYFSVDMVGNRENINVSKRIGDDIYTLAESKGNFSVVIVGDIHVGPDKIPARFKSQVDWIANNVEKENIRFVAQVGDIVDIQPRHNRIDQFNMFSNAARTMEYIFGKVPFSIAIGNHDYDNYNYEKKDSRMFNTYFPLKWLSSQKDFGGSFEPEKSDNTYQFFKGAAMKWLVITLEYCPRKSAVDWANKIVSNYPDHRVILLTHMYTSDKFIEEGICLGGNYYGPKQLWNSLISRHNNIYFVFSGHWGTKFPVVLNITQNRFGKPVYQYLTNYQWRDAENVEVGYLRILKIDTGKNQIAYTGYSPYLGKHEIDADRKFDVAGVDFLNTTRVLASRSPLDKRKLVRTTTPNMVNTAKN